MVGGREGGIGIPTRPQDGTSYKKKELGFHVKKEKRKKWLGVK